MSLCSVKVDTPIPSAKCSKVSMIDILKSFYTPGLFGTTTVDDQIQKV